MEAERREVAWGERETCLVDDDKPCRGWPLGHPIAEGPRPRTQA